MEWFWTFPLLSRAAELLGAGLVLVTVGTVVVLRRPATRRRRYAVRLAIGAAAGGAVLLAVGWVLGDVLVVFDGVPLGRRTLTWSTVVGASLGVVAVATASRGQRRPRPWHHGAVPFALGAVVVLGFVGINRDFAYFLNPQMLLRHGTIPGATWNELPSPTPSDAVELSGTWTPPPGQPSVGRLTQVSIPGTRSGFAARPALVYLPPAALVPDPPRLPLIVALSGQPGTPADMFTAGRLQVILEAYQALHNGVAPIVVSPDQLGSSSANPMCADTGLGNAETYLIDDVMPWIHARLGVSKDPRRTLLLGFSQGATCTAQLGFEHPDVFGTLAPIAPELVPTVGADTLTSVFHGDEAAYESIQPLTILQAHGHYDDVRADFYAGAGDATFSGYARTIAAAATAQGVDATVTLIPGSAHDWRTVAQACSEELDRAAPRLGLPS